MSAVERKLTLVELKQMIGSVEGLESRPKNGFSLFQSGFPSGKLVEVSGTGKTEFISTFIKEQFQQDPDMRVAWIEDELTINPFGLWQRGLEIEKFLFVESKEVNWAIGQVLQSQLFKIVVISCLQFDEKELRRFQLLTEKSEGHSFLLSEQPHQSWVPSLQLEVTKLDRALNVEVIRQRGYS